MSDSTKIKAYAIKGAEVRVGRHYPFPDNIEKRNIPPSLTAYTTCHNTIQALENIFNTKPTTAHAVDHFRIFTSVKDEKELNKFRVLRWFPEDKESQEADDIRKSASTWMKCGHTNCKINEKTSNELEGRVSCQLLFKIYDEATRRNIDVDVLPKLPEFPYIEQSIEEAVEDVDEAEARTDEANESGDRPGLADFVVSEPSYMEGSSGDYR